MSNHVFFIYAGICPTINKLIIDIYNKNHIIYEDDILSKPCSDGNSHRL